MKTTKKEQISQMELKAAMNSAATPCGRQIFDCYPVAFKDLEITASLRFIIGFGWSPPRSQK